MRHTINYIAALLMLSLALLSCSRETGLKMDEGAGNTVRFTIESSLRAAGDENTTRPTPALERERKIESLYAVVYKTSSGLHHKTVQCTDLTNGKFEFDNEKSGEFYFFLVANPDADLVAKLMAGPSTPEDLGMLVATQTPGEDNRASSFLMTSDRKNVTVQSKKSTDLGAIKLVRVAARFDIYNTIDGLEIQKITFGKRRVQSHLFAQVGKMAEIKATENDKVYDGSLFESNTLKATIYGYETDVRNETFFTIEATYKGKPLKPETVRLENFVIKRNHLYNIILHDVGGAHEPDDPTKKFGQFQYTIKVIDWNDSEKGINYAEDNILKPFYVDFAAQISNAPYMTPYLVNSPEEVYTTTKEASEVTITVGGYTEPGTLAFAEGFANTMNATLTDLGNPTTDPKTGKISHSYKLSIPAMTDFVPLVKDGKPAKPEFQEIPLVAKNYSGATVKNVTIKHGRIKMPIEYVTEHSLAPHTDGEDFKFATNDADFNNVGYFYALGFQKEHKQVTIDGKKYHLPDYGFELNSIFPQFNNPSTGYSYYSVGENARAVDNASCWVVMPCWAYLVGGKSGTVRVTSDYRTDIAKKVSYGLRLKKMDEGYNNMLVTAYRYEWVGDWTPITTGAVTSYYKVTTRYLGPNWNGGVDGIAKEEFWNNNNKNDATRRFYALGRKDGDEPLQIGEQAIIISSVSVDYNNQGKKITDDQVKSRVTTALLTNRDCSTFMNVFGNKPKNSTTPRRFPVRLFSDK